jgi:hypothetical protein
MMPRELTLAQLPGYTLCRSYGVVDFLGALLQIWRSYGVPAQMFVEWGRVRRGNGES